MASYTVINDTLKALNPALGSHDAFVRTGIHRFGWYKSPVHHFHYAFQGYLSNYAPKVVNDTVIAIKDQELFYNVLANDSDVEGDQLLITAVGTPAHGKASFSVVAQSYTPNAGYVGADEFTYTVSRWQFYFYR